MIEFKNIKEEAPYVIFKKKYEEALSARQKNIEAIAISTYNKKNNEVDSRFVNLKIVDGNKFIFFSNYNSPKSLAFDSFNQISALFFWSSINTQVRMKGLISKTSKSFNKEYFKNRSLDKNALAISSNQSNVISSYDDVLAKYYETKEKKDLYVCPEYWGGFEFSPYYFEFWDGHESRINKRTIFKKNNKCWNQLTLEP